MTNFFIRCLLLFVCLLPAARATQYGIDTAHTYASFEIDHLGFSLQRGWFTQTSGTIDYDPEKRTGSAEIRIASASLDTGFEKRDEILRGDSWFKTKDFPDIIFRSRQFIYDEAGKLTAIDGTLMLLGEVRPLRLDVTRVKCGFNLAKRKQGCGADAFGTLRRSDFGFSNGVPHIADEVRLRIQVEAYLP